MANGKNLSQNSTASSPTASLVETLDRMMTSAYGSLWTGIPKSPQQMKDRLSLWGHMFSTQRMTPERLRHTIFQSPVSFPERPPTPGQFASLYRSLPKTEEQYVGPAETHVCSRSGCTAQGTMTESITGSDRWYCRQHSHNGMFADRGKPEPTVADNIQAKFGAVLAAELEEQRRLGPDEYRRQSKERRDAFLNKIAARTGIAAQYEHDEDYETGPSGPQLGDHMSDEAFFAKNPGWRAYKRGEEDLQQALLSKQKMPR